MSETEQQHQKRLERHRIADRKWRAKNLEKITEKNRRYREENREELNARSRAWNAENLEKKRAGGRASYHNNRVKNKEKHNARRRFYTAKCRFLAIRHYSQGTFACACCGDTRYEGLEVDHLNNDGNKHRREIVKGQDIPRWLIRNDYPEGFQILCGICNKSKWRHKGVCCHDMQRPTEEDFQ